MDLQQTLILVKPDAVARGLIGKILSRFEAKGFRVLAMSITIPTEKFLEEHYEEHADKPYWPNILDSMRVGNGAIAAFVIEGYEVVAQARKMLGATKPENAEPGTIRFDLASHLGRNICHASDSIESAMREIDLWFPNDNLILKQYNHELTVRED